MLWNALTQFYAREKPEPFKVLDLAAGAGEASTVLLEWFTACQQRKGSRRLTVTPIDLNATKPSIVATDAFTEPAFRAAHPDIPFHALSFAQTEDIPESGFDLCIVSFALHLVTTTSELWTCLDALSRKCRWLLIISPHKKPEIKNHVWGWSRWNMDTWEQDSDDAAEVVQERVRGRLYKSNHQSGDY
jgi:predicted nicotinamide N-methyase